MQEFTVGELAADLGVKAKTVRYYDEIGLLSAARRSSAGYRLYEPRDRESLRFILKAKAVGLSLTEIREIVTIKDRGERPCAHVATLLDAKLGEVEQRLGALKAYRLELRRMRQHAKAGDQAGGGVCSIIEDHTIARPEQIASVTGITSRDRFKSSR